MDDPYGKRGFVKYCNFIVFNDDGTFTEEVFAPLEPPTLTSYVYSRSTEEWFGVVIYGREIKWQTIEADDVPAPLRALQLIMF